MKATCLLAGIAALLGAATVTAAPPLYRPVQLKGWAPKNAGDCFLTSTDLGLSHATDFSVAMRVTFPETLAAKAAVLSLGDPATHQVSLTVWSGNYAYLSSAHKSGGTNVLLGEWKIPTGEEGLEPALLPGKTKDIALTYTAATKAFALWIDGKQQALTLNTSAVNSKDDPAAPTLKREVAFPSLRLSGRIYGDVVADYTFAGGAYANVGVFGFALNAEQVAQLHEANATLDSFVAQQENVVTVDFAAKEGVTSQAWQAEWDGKVVLIRGAGTLEVAGTAAPKELLLADRAALTVRCKMGAGIVAQDLLTVGDGATVSADFTGLPERSGAYAVLSDKAGTTIPPLTSATPPAIPEGTAAYLPENWLAEGKASIAIIPTAEDGAYLLVSPLDYEWYLADCPATASVRLTQDIALDAKAYTAKAEFGGTFDGDGHTLTFPEGATMEGAAYAGLVCGTSPTGSALIVKNLRVVMNGTIAAKGSSCGAVVGGCGAYSDSSTSSSFENLHVIIGGALNAASAKGGTGGVVGEFWGSWAGKGPMRNLRVELLPTAKLNAPCSSTSGRGVGGVMGGAANPVAMEHVLVVLHQGATLTSAKQCGGVVAMARAKYAAKSISVVDFGATFSKTAPYFHASNAPTLTDITCFRSDAAKGTAPTGAAVVRMETGSFQARDGATVALLGDTEANRLVALPMSDVWAVEAAEGANTVKVSPSDSPDLNPGTTQSLEYAFHAFTTAPEGTLWSDTVTAACTFTMRAADGAIELYTAKDYEWYLANCPNGATVRMKQDITLEAKEYRALVLNTLTFDGDGHTVTLPKGATINGSGSTTGSDYSGVVAGQLYKGEIKNVMVVVGGKVWAKPYAGAVLGASTWDSGGAVSLKDVRVLLKEGSEIASTPGSGNNAHTGGLVGRNYNSPITLSSCTILLEAGSKLTNGNATAATKAQTAAVCGGVYTGKETGVTVVDLGATMPAKASYSRDTKGTITLYKASNLSTAYGTAVAATPVETMLQGEQEGIVEDGTLTLVTGEAPMVSAAKAEGWTLAWEGNTVTVSEGPGGVCSLTYGLEGFEGMEIPVSFTPMTLADLPEGVAATPAQKSLLMAAAAKAVLPIPAKVAFRTGSKQPTLDALEVFEGILRADKESGALVVGYDFGISKVTVAKDEETDAQKVAVTVRVQTDEGLPATFVEGAQVKLVRTFDGTPLGDPIIIAPGAEGNEVVCHFPLGDATELFRAQIAKASE